MKKLPLLLGLLAFAAPLSASARDYYSNFDSFLRRLSHYRTTVYQGGWPELAL